ncbi:MAG: hypothetical protein GY853_08195 [PVC group bacterium]|nr:hypothetical protein [PVC group bacterium]
MDKKVKSILIAAALVLVVIVIFGVSNTMQRVSQKTQILKDQKPGDQVTDKKPVRIYKTNYGSPSKAPLGTRAQAPIQRAKHSYYFPKEMEKKYVDPFIEDPQNKDAIPEEHRENNESITSGQKQWGKMTQEEAGFQQYPLEPQMEEPYKYLFEEEEPKAQTESKEEGKQQEDAAIEG